MALKPPHPNIEHLPRGKITEEMVRELSRKVQRNQDYFSRQFPMHGNYIVNETIVTKKIAEESITTKLLESEAVTAEKIKAGTITAELIEASSITADKLKVTELSAISANLGEIESGKVTGATVQTASIGKRVVMDSSGLRAINASNENVLNFSISTGKLTITGGAIESGTIIGASIKTATSGARVEMDSLGIRGINASAVEKFHFDTTTGILTASAVISSETGSEINTEHLAGQITETQIEDDSISSPKIQANAVEAKHIIGETLSAISADLGEVTAGTITGVTITGVTIKATNAFQLNQSTSATSPEVKNAVQWLDTESGSARSEVWGAAEASTAHLVLAANRNKATSHAKVIARASNSSGTLAELFSESTITEQRVGAVASGESATILNQTGQSSFLQLTSAAKRKINTGETTLKWSATEEKFVSEIKEVEHGLGATPKQVWYTLPRGEATTEGVVTASSISGSYTSTKFKVRGYSDKKLAKSTEVTVQWTATG